jgi:hypothetical protein
MNARRRSTQGWSILNILLDFLGGTLSLGQQLLTCWWTGNWWAAGASGARGRAEKGGRGVCGLGIPRALPEARARGRSVLGLRLRERAAALSPRPCSP